MSFPKLMSWSAGVALTLAAAGPLAANEFPNISHNELVQAVKNRQAVILDANGTESYKAGHIPGALNYAAVKGKLKTSLPANKGALVVAYCGNERCGAYKTAAEEARRLGYTNVKHYAPGLAGWKKAGEKLEKAN